MLNVTRPTKRTTLRGPLLRLKREKPEDRFAAEIRVTQARDFRGNATVQGLSHNSTFIEQWAAVTIGT